MASLTLSRVRLDYSIYSVRAQSLKNAIFGLAVGGKMFRAPGDITVVRALNDVSFELKDGDRLALVGHNGSGKTSLLRVIAGIYEETAGVMEIDGDITSMISITAGMDMEDTGLQNIRKLCMMRMLPKALVEERIPAIVDFSGLGDFVRLPVKTYSAGMLARLMFATATEFEPDILVLDEWLSAGDADFVAKAADRMNALVEKARIVVLATHDPSLVKRVCNKVCDLDAGSVAFFGSPAEWERRRALQAA